MRYRKLSSTGDYSFGHGQLDFLINSPAAVAQAVETTLKLFQGEWYLNVNDGTPYLEGVVGMHSKAEADATILNVIQSVQGVQNIQNFQSVLDPSTRSYRTISGTLNTIYGPTQLQIETAGDF